MKETEFVEKEFYSIFALSNETRGLLKFHSPSMAFVYYKSFRLNLLTGEKEKFPITAFNESLGSLYLNQKFNRPLVYHFFYEWGHSLHGLDHLIDEEKILVIEILYTQANNIQLEEEGGSERKKLELVPVNSLTFREYQLAFKKGYENLLDGNCYQFNLTFKHKFAYSRHYHPHDFIYRVWRDKKNVGAYAHLSHIPYLKKMFLSNSPECLFQLKRKGRKIELYSMPIKGSKKYSKESEVNCVWEKLKDSRKDEAELFMIADLLRNDLSKIEDPVSEVMKKKEKLVVPGIIHQFSVIRVLLSLNLTLGKIMNSLYPGGSITGAPKLRVLEILKEIEQEDRGFYTGSTLLLYRDIQAASINIRSAEIDLEKRSLVFGAGGGITLLSDPALEYEEMMEKVNSFLILL